MAIGSGFSAEYADNPARYSVCRLAKSSGKDDGVGAGLVFMPTGMKFYKL
jgi:hypothetical protein